MGKVEQKKKLWKAYCMPVCEIPADKKLPELSKEEEKGVSIYKYVPGNIQMPRKI